jgi:hypothetical protein
VASPREVDDGGHWRAVAVRVRDQGERRSHEKCGRKVTWEGDVVYVSTR